MDQERCRRIVKLAASKAENDEAKTWLTWDEHGVHERSADEYLERTAAKAAELKLTESEVDEQVAIALLLDVLQAQINAVKSKGG